MNNPVLIKPQKGAKGTRNQIGMQQNQWVVSLKKLISDLLGDYQC